MLLTRLTVVQSLLQLSSRNLVKAHADQVVRINLGDRVCFFDKLESFLAVEFPLGRIMLVFGHVQLVAGKHVHSFDPKLLVFKKMSLLLSVVNAFRVQSFTQNVGESLDLVSTVVHELQSYKKGSRYLQQLLTSIQWVLFQW